MNAIDFTEDMNEVSGFHGFYERCCRAGIVAGARWCAANPNAVTTFREFKDVFGLCMPESDDAVALESAILAAPVTRDDGTKSRLSDELTGAQFHAIVHHVRFIASKGWDAYVAEMTEPMRVYNESEETENTDESAI
jgi:hypothetical protein